jgi:serine/threonine protein kinase
MTKAAPDRQPPLPGAAAPTGAEPRPPGDPSAGAQPGPDLPSFVGEYRIHRSLGAGAMAEVLLGSVAGPGGFERKFAIKRVHRRLLQDRQFVAMLLDEARIAGLLHHANVVSVHGVHEEGNDLYLVMDYVEGVTLAALTQSLRTGGGQVPVEITVRVMLDLLSALEAIHALTDADGHDLCVVHRDVAPRNVLVGTDGICRLTDFGVARARGRITETPQGFVKGTLGYLAPEGIFGPAVDQRTDLYAAGVILWELLAGERLFRRGPNANRRPDPRLTRPPGRVVDPCSINREAPAPLADVCLRALEPSPADRYASASDMAAALEEAMTASGVSDPGPRLTGRLVSALERIKTLVPLAPGPRPGTQGPPPR